MQSSVWADVFSCCVSPENKIGIEMSSTIYHEKQVSLVFIFSFSPFAYDNLAPCYRKVGKSKLFGLRSKNIHVGLFSGEAVMCCPCPK